MQNQLSGGDQTSDMDNRKAERRSGTDRRSGKDRRDPNGMITYLHDDVHRRVSGTRRDRQRRSGRDRRADAAVDEA